MCHNLGVANPQADPYTPSWEIIGGYWQWGRKNLSAKGPSGPNPSQANQGEISGWDNSSVENEYWNDNFKTKNDPCPLGFRVPTKSQWDGVLGNNTLTRTGTWEGSLADYSSGLKIGDKLFLPAAGLRSGRILALCGRRGDYWSSTMSSSYSVGYMFFYNAGSGTFSNGSSSDGRSVRCIAE
jgi:uncharacterized protein (TIGR02145 family)